MKTHWIVTLGLMALVCGVGVESARAEGPIVKREEKQQDRIAQGLNSGQLTAGEAARLEKGEAKIEKNREKAWADGKLTGHEKRKLERQENKESRRIYRAKHNNRKQP